MKNLVLFLGLSMSLTAFAQVKKNVYVSVKCQTEEGIIKFKSEINEKRCNTWEKGMVNTSVIIDSDSMDYGPYKNTVAYASKHGVNILGYITDTGYVALEIRTDDKDTTVGHVAAGVISARHKNPYAQKSLTGNCAIKYLDKKEVQKNKTTILCGGE